MMRRKDTICQELTDFSPAHEFDFDEFASKFVLATSKQEAERSKSSKMVKERAKKVMQQKKEIASKIKQEETQSKKLMEQLKNAAKEINKNYADIAASEARLKKRMRETASSLNSRLQRERRAENHHNLIVNWTRMLLLHSNNEETNNNNDNCMTRGVLIAGDKTMKPFAFENSDKCQLAENLWHLIGSTFD